MSRVLQEEKVSGEQSDAAEGPSQSRSVVASGAAGYALFWAAFCSGGEEVASCWPGGRVFTLLIYSLLVIYIDYYYTSSHSVVRLDIFTSLTYKIQSTNIQQY